MAAQTYGPYIVNAALGEGGMASVVRATDMNNGNEVALKILSRDRRADIPGLKDRLLREAEVLRALSHIPAVVRLLDVFEDEPTGADVLVLEYVRGQTLADRFRQQRPGVLQVVEWMGHVCHAMHDIHEAGYVHRDLKPENVLIADNAEVALKIIDFNSAGRAAQTTGKLTRVQGAFPHTPAYLAPECFDGVPPDASADVYALGMTFAELLIGRHPLLPDEDDTTTKSAWQQAHEDVPLPDLSSFDDAIPEALQHVLERATAKDRADRIPDAMVLWSELKRVWDEMQQAPAPSDKPPPPPPQTPLGWKLATAAMSLSTFLALIGVLVVGVLWREALAELEDAEFEKALLQRDVTRLQGELELAKRPAPAPIPIAVPKPSPKLNLAGTKNLLVDKPIGIGIGISQHIGLLRQDLEPGEGWRTAKRGDAVRFHYTLTLADGSPVQHSLFTGPIKTTIGSGAMIKGIDEGLIGMKLNGKRKLTIPAYLGYGEQGSAAVPPNATLIATVNLVGFDS